MPLIVKLHRDDWNVIIRKKIISQIDNRCLKEFFICFNDHYRTALADNDFYILGGDAGLKSEPWSAPVH